MDPQAILVYPGIARLLVVGGGMGRRDILGLEQAGLPLQGFWPFGLGLRLFRERASWWCAGQGEVDGFGEKTGRILMSENLRAHTHTHIHTPETKDQE